LLISCFSSSFLCQMSISRGNFTLICILYFQDQRHFLIKAGSILDRFYSTIISKQHVTQLFSSLCNYFCTFWKSEFINDYHLRNLCIDGRINNEANPWQR
jgi:hypothetical protein